MGSRHRRLLFVLCLLFFVSLLPRLSAQDRRFYRVYFVDKGTPDRVLLPTDPFYGAATAHLTERALKRRAKVLNPDSLVSTADLPVFQPYLDSLTSLGVQVAQTSRWLNSAMIRTDSTTFESLKTLPFLSSTEVVRTIPEGAVPVGKLPPPDLQKANVSNDVTLHSACIVDAYGLADRQNREIGLDEAHKTGFAGEGILVGILDAGFDWRSHESLRNAHVIAEHDFVNGDDNTADEPEQTPSESHGTLVMSIIGGWLEGSFIGGAPRADFALAKTEDVGSELHIEEDNFVAGLEWLEALGVDVTNTSLGYTTFDAPEQGHTYDELDGHTVFASRGVNHAAQLGVICVLAAGNEARSYRYVSVPAEADSAIAVAALGTDSSVAGFSSRGFGLVGRVKPDVAAPGVGVYGAEASTPDGFVAQQGTSLASPLVTASVAVILSARPSLKPWEVKRALFRTADNADAPDTAVGYGMIHVDRALSYLTRDGERLAGEPKIIVKDGAVSIASWLVGGAPEHLSERFDGDQSSKGVQVELENITRHDRRLVTSVQPYNGLGRWLITHVADEIGWVAGDSIEFGLSELGTGNLLRRTTLAVANGLATPVSTLCNEPPQPVTALAAATPNPFSDRTYIQFVLDRTAPVTLEIFNTKGERILSLISNQIYDPGVYAIPFRPQGLAGGAYYYRLKVNDAVYSEQMIYLR